MVLEGSKFLHSMAGEWSIRAAAAVTGLQVSTEKENVYKILLSITWDRAVAWTEITTVRVITARDLGCTAAVALLPQLS